MSDTKTISAKSAIIGALIGAAITGGVIALAATAPPTPGPKLHYIAIWTVVLNAALPPETNPYTGEQQATSVAKQKRILKILWHGFTNNKDAEDFKTKSPEEIKKTMRIDEVAGGYDE